MNMLGKIRRLRFRDGLSMRDLPPHRTGEEHRQALAEGRGRSGAKIPAQGTGDAPRNLSTTLRHRWSPRYVKHSVDDGKKSLLQNPVAEQDYFRLNDTNKGEGGSKSSDNVCVS